MLRSNVLRSFFISKKWVRISLFGVLIIPIILLLKVWLAVVFTNDLNIVGTMLQQKDQVGAFESYWINFLYIGVSFAALDIVLGHTKRRCSYFWREAILEWYTPQWVRHHERVKHIENAGHRIHEDARELPRHMVELYDSTWYALLTTVGFFPMLWTLSKDFHFGVPVAGMLLWGVIAVTLIDTLVSCFVGRKLPHSKQINKYDEDNYHSTFEKVAHGTRLSHRAKMQEFETVKGAIKSGFQRTHRYQLYFDLWKSFYSQAWALMPLCVLGLYVCSGTISYGELLQTTAALMAVRGSLSVISDNWSSVVTDVLTEWHNLRKIEIAFMHSAVPSNVIAIDSRALRTKHTGARV